VTLTAALLLEGPSSVPSAESLAANPRVSRVLALDPSDRARPAPASGSSEKLRFLSADFRSSAGIREVIAETRTDFLLLVLPGGEVRPGQGALERLLSTATDTGSAWTYADFREESDGSVTDHPLIDHQLGSIRDTFDFGPLVLISKIAAEQAWARHGLPPELRWGGLYDLRLKIATDGRVLRVPEPLSTRVPTDRRTSGERDFDYVDPRRREYQLEMEAVATAHLRRLGAWLEPVFDPVLAVTETFPVRASVVIPVRNREKTIGDAVDSALAQRASFDFNVLVVDNHSTDRTGAILAERARRDPRLIPIVPARTDLGIGGCWNVAIDSPRCGQYAVQLDSDDLYASDRVLEAMVNRFQEGPFAMVVGSYTVVNYGLQEIPPGLIDHREWTRENGRNNALRVNGLGAPRAFLVPVLREASLPNVSYGEDYAAALRISRRYEIGRIYDSVYLARRWEGNSDAALPPPAANRYDAYKDHLRTVEILARQRRNQERSERSRA
jgi:Glycosyl transferase family 2